MEVAWARSQLSSSPTEAQRRGRGPTTPEGSREQRSGVMAAKLNGPCKSPSVASGESEEKGELVFFLNAWQDRSGREGEKGMPLFNICIL